MFIVNKDITANDLLPKLTRFFDLSGKKINLLEKEWDPKNGTPVLKVAKELGLEPI